MQRENKSSGSKANCYLQFCIAAMIVCEANPFGILFQTVACIVAIQYPTVCNAALATNY